MAPMAFVSAFETTSEAETDLVKRNAGRVGGPGLGPGPLSGRPSERLEVFRKAFSREGKGRLISSSRTALAIVQVDGEIVCVISQLFINGIYIELEEPISLNGSTTRARKGKWERHTGLFWRYSRRSCRWLGEEMATY